MESQTNRTLKAAVACLIGLMSIIGSVASVIALSEGGIKWLLLSLFAVSGILAMVLAVLHRVDVPSAWNLITIGQGLGIRRLFSHGGHSPNSQMTISLKSAKTIRVLAVSGQAFLKANKAAIVEALSKNAATLQVLLATQRSQFVQELERAESESRVGQIDPEIDQSLALLREYQTNAEAQAGPNVQVGRIEVRHFSSQFRESMILCDASWGWLTLSLPPKRAVETMSVELVTKQGGLLLDCVEHFEVLWRLSEPPKGLNRL